MNIENLPFEKVSPMPGVDNLRVSRAFRAEFPGLTQASVDPLYALPIPLIESIQRVVALRVERLNQEWDEAAEHRKLAA